MYKIVFMRHGESTWNLSNRFTGWTDVDLTEKGVSEAKAAGKVRMEGKEYIMADGDVVEFRFNV